MLGPTLKFYFDVFLQDMFAAGTDTSSAAIEWTMAELIRNPRAMEILQNEVRQVVKNEEDINEDDIEKMPYLKGVIKESLRQHSVTRPARVDSGHQSDGLRRRIRYTSDHQRMVDCKRSIIVGESSTF